MLNSIQENLHPLIIKKIGRDRLEYFTSNTMNWVTERLDPFLWSYECKAKIVAIQQETDDTKTFTLLPNQHFQQPAPGQHVQVSVEIEGEQVKRDYTLSHIQTHTVSITVKKQPNGRMSHWLHNQAHVGSVLAVSSPKGQYIYENQKKVLFISAGSGITPTYAILDSIPHSAPVDSALYYRSRSPEQTIFKKALDALPELRCYFSFSQSNRAKQSGEGDTLSEEQWRPSQIQGSVPDLNERHIYLCGPEAFKESVVRFLKEIEYNFEHLRVENFTPVHTRYNPETGFDGDITVILKSRNIRFNVSRENRGKTILEAAEFQGIQMEHGCRSGMCGTCRTHLIEGKVSGNQLGSSIYPCTAYANSPEVTLE